jgi:TatD DNase family protein
MGMDRPGVLHSFSGGPDLADKALEMGFYLGFTGPVTFKKADNLRTLVAGVPKDRLLVETDAPFLSPHPFRGKRNEPARVRLILERIAGLHGLETCELAQITTENAVRLFGDKLAVHISHRPARH